jgi:FdhD protein
MRNSESESYTAPCLLIKGGIREESAVQFVVEETVIALFVNGRHATTSILSPGHLEEYTVGYLFSEEIIRSADDIESIRYEKNRISVLTKDPFRITGRRKTILAGCGGSTSFIDISKLPVIESDYTISSSAIADAVPLRYHGIEYAVLADGNGVIRSFQDLDSSSAVDRVIGYGLLNAVDFSHTFLVVREKITSEMVRRCLLAGIPILVSSGMITRIAIEIAEGTNLCLAGLLSGGEMALFSHPERVRGF